MKSTIFLIIILANTGYHAIYQVMIFRAKLNASVLIRNGNHPELMQRIILPVKDAQAFDQDEVTYNGILFDVYKKTPIRDSVILYLYPDSAEQSVLIELVNYFKSDDGNPIPAGEKIFQAKSFHVGQDQIAQRAAKYTIRANSLIFTVYSLQNTTEVSNRIRNVLIPPPKFFRI